MAPLVLLLSLFFLAFDLSAAEPLLDSLPAEEGTEEVLEDIPEPLPRIRHQRPALPVSIFELEGTRRRPLPFRLADAKRLEIEDLKTKKEGWYITGLPLISSDPVNGFGLGADGFMYYNGDRTDPFFDYTPYRRQLQMHLLITNKMQKEVLVSGDFPFLFNSKWRLRFEGSYEDNPNLLYFGQTASTMNTLNYNGKSEPTYSGYLTDISKVQAGGITDALYNTYRMQEGFLGASLERSFLRGTLRLVGGFEVSGLNVSTFDGSQTEGINSSTGQSQTATAGTSLLTIDKNNNGLLGYGHSFMTMAQFGVVYDTRDLEPDPNRGGLIEFTEEFSATAIGSQYTFNKIFLHGKYFWRIFPSVFNRLIFGARAGLSHTDGNAPFFELQEAWSTEGPIEGLGGMRTLRGYKQGRFLGRWLGFLNFELRYQFQDYHFWGQHLELMFVPFVDAGRVWDRLSDIGFGGFRADGGAGLRIAWNQSTVLMADYAVSSEDHQFFLNYGHIF